MNGAIVRVALVVLVVASGLLLGRFMAGDTEPLADLRIYERAGEVLWDGKDPYSINAGRPVALQYRYPPLLAMVMPIVRWIWLPLVAGGIALAIARRREGIAGRWLPAHVGGVLVANVLNGNAQGVIVGVGSLAPTMHPLVGVGVGVAAWIKIYPAAIALWWIGRREWRVLGWFGATVVVLGAIQIPWLGEFVRYSRTQTDLPPVLSLRAFGIVPWLAVVAALAVLTFTRARSPQGWLWCVLLQIAALPTTLAFNVPLLLMHPTVLASSYRPLAEPSRTAAVTLAVAAAIIAVGTVVLFVVS